jgi:hypothetical protein
MQDLSIIGPRRYESKTLPQKAVGKVKRKVTDNSQISPAPKKAKGYVVMVMLIIFAG